ncbi:MAG: argininosuccinate lyase [Pseudomonadota bacterium]
MTKMWGGRFRSDPDERLWAFTRSEADRRMLPFDVQGSSAHVRMLARAGLLAAEEETALLNGLALIAAEAKENAFPFSSTDEDLHSAVERRLRELVGEVADKIHTGRSRNDQVCLDLRLYLSYAARKRIGQLRTFVETLVTRSGETTEIVVPAYTHLQQAQAIPLGHHLLAYAWMMVRDVERFIDVRKRIEVSPLGAGAVGGSSLPLDPSSVAKELGFSSAFSNSIDAVASRDFVAEYAFCVAQTMTHLSRLAEEIILWNTKEFGWVTLPDSLATGSSMLPQKKNPDIAELIRGRSAKVIGELTSLLVLQKGVPLSYNRDLQEDKALVFGADDTLASALSAAEALLSGLRFHPPAPDPSILAIDLAEVLVSRGVPFRQAHKAVGELVLALEESGCTLAQATSNDLTSAHSLFRSDDLTLLDPKRSVERRRTLGGGSTASVKTQIEELKRRIDDIGSCT